MLTAQQCCRDLSDPSDICSSRVAAKLDRGANCHVFIDSRYWPAIGPIAFEPNQRFPGRSMQRWCTTCVPFTDLRSHEDHRTNHICFLGPQCSIEDSFFKTVYGKGEDESRQRSFGRRCGFGSGKFECLLFHLPNRLPKVYAMWKLTCPDTIQG